MKTGEKVEFECPFCKEKAVAEEHESDQFDWNEKWWEGKCLNISCKANKVREVGGDWEMVYWMDQYED